MYTVKRTFELTADVIQIKAAQAGLFSSFFLGKTGSTFFSCQFVDARNKFRCNHGIRIHS